MKWMAKVPSSRPEAGMAGRTPPAGATTVCGRLMPSIRGPQVFPAGHGVGSATSVPLNAMVRPTNPVVSPIAGSSSGAVIG